MASVKAEEEAAIVRQTIVAKYDRGYQPDELEEWEDASYIIYQVTDRYGFMHKNPLANDRDAKLLIQEREREVKWMKMLDKWDKYTRSEKLRKRIYKGIPDSMRALAWKRLLDVEHIQNRSKVYQELRNQARLYSPDIRQIDLDVNRTYRDHIMFRDRYGTKQQDLFHVLASYSIYNQEVGYCQGMSGIAALLLMYLNEEDAFWAFSVLITNSQRHAMHGFFIPGFPKLKRFQDHHEVILKKFAPKLFKHLEKEGVYTSLYTLKWFMQCFLDRTPFPLTLRLWDAFLLEGDKILTAMAYNLMKIHKKKFIKQPMEDIVEFLQEKMSGYPYNIDQMMDLLQETTFELRKGGLESPPAPSNLEFPKQPPGSSLQRGTFETASARARKNKRKDQIIEMPVGKPLSPTSPSSVDGSERNRVARSSSGRRSESSGNQSTDSNIHVGTVTPVDGYRVSQIDTSPHREPHVSSVEPHLVSSRESHLPGEPHPPRYNEPHHLVAREAYAKQPEPNRGPHPPHPEPHRGPHPPSHVEPYHETRPTSQSLSHVVFHQEPRPHSTEPHSGTHPSPNLDTYDDGPGRVKAVLSSTEVAKFNQDLKNSYLRSQQRFMRAASGRRQNGSQSAPLERIHSPSSPDHDRSRGNPEIATMTISLPGAVNSEQRNYSPTIRTKPSVSAGSPLHHQDPVSPMQNGTASLAHAPVWQQEGPEGTMQFTLAQAPNRQMTFV